MSRPPWPYGRTIVDGELQFASPTSLTLADPDSEGCFRKFWYQVLRGIKSPPTKSQQIGVDLHAEIERYLLTGEKRLSSLALSGLHAIPDPIPPGAPAGTKPGSDLGIELDIGGGSLAVAPVRADGLPVVGYIDLVHERGTNKGTDDVLQAFDPPNTIEVIDWKTTGDKKWIKSPNEMARTIQMTTYARWAFTVAPKAEHVRLSHVYFVTRGAAHARKVSLRVVREPIERRWEQIEALARTLRHVARETDPDKVPANLNACGAYGGCPAREVCTAAMRQALADFVGPVEADKHFPKEHKDDMGLTLLDQIRQKAAAKPEIQPATVVSPAAPTGDLPAAQLSSGFGGVVHGNDAAKKAAEEAAAKQKAEAEALARLQAEEEATRALVQFTEALQALEALRCGLPQLSGDAAALYAKVKNHAPAAGFAGSGHVGQINVSDVATMQKLAAEVLEAVRSGALVPEPEKAAPAAPTAPIGGLLSPETPASKPAAAAPALPAIEGAPADAPPAEKPATKKGKKAKEELASVPASPTASMPSPLPVIVPDAINLFVDVLIDQPIATSFQPILDKACTDLCTKFGAADLRCAPDQTPLAFGKWKGALTAYLREIEVPPSTYVLDTQGSEIAQVAAEAMRLRCRQTGGIFLRGVR